jgi:TolB-like protein
MLNARSDRNSRHPEPVARSESRGPDAALPESAESAECPDGEDSPLASTKDRPVARLLSIQPKGSQAISEATVREAVSRILKSSMFLRSERLGRFLQYTVETTLEGNAALLKEYLIGTVVYGRQSSFHPGEDSIVRSEARRLRQKLREYYDSAGKLDRVAISYRPGSYVPSFVAVRKSRGDAIRSETTLAHQFSEERGLRTAVLPFVDLSNAACSRACAQIITEELTHELVRTDGLRVTAERSVVPLIAQGLDLPALAQRLNLQIIFEGTVREHNNELRITCNAVNADGFQIWSERFQAAPDSQAVLDIAEKIAMALSIRVRPEQSFLEDREKSDESTIAAYPLVFGAEAQLDAATLRHAQSALASFRAVTELMPDSARPLCGMALSCCELALHGVPNSAAIVFEASDAIERAVLIEPHMALVPTCIGSIRTLEGKWHEAEAHFEEALCLWESATTYHQYALLLSALGRFDEARHYLGKAEGINPFSCRVKMSCARLLYLSQEYDQGVNYISENASLRQLPVESELYRAMMLISLDRHSQAQQVIAGFRSAVGIQPAVMSGVAEALARCGDTEAARRIVREHNLLSRNSPISKFRQALLFAAFSDSENAIRSLCVARENSEAELIWLSQEPRLDEIRTDPRVCRLLTKSAPAHLC